MLESRRKMKQVGTAIILAGGKSSRMGFDKQFLKIENRRLMNSIINQLKEEFDEIIIVTNKPENYLGLSHKIAVDEIKDKGPLGGIHAGLKIASSQYALVMACDMPNVNMAYIRYMMENLGQHGCTTKFGEWIEPFCSFYSKDMVEDIEKYLQSNRRSIHQLLQTLDFNYIEEEDARRFSPDWEMFLNLNTKKDLEIYLQSLEKDYA